MAEQNETFWALLGGAQETPWKAINEVERYLIWPLARLRFAAAGIAWGRGWRIYGMPIIQKHQRSTLRIGPGLSLRSTVRSNPLGPGRPAILCTWTAGAILRIGADFGMTGGSIVAAESVLIGDRVMMGADSIITDTDFHPLDPARRQTNPADGATAPVRIEDDVFIGMRCLILKGVTLGAGCVIGAGSVVTQSIPAGAVAAGNPAQVLRDKVTSNE
jgi:acetyltransferase-like isoleucine patch superfamily enzyme